MKQSPRRIALLLVTLLVVSATGALALQPAPTAEHRAIAADDTPTEKATTAMENLRATNYTYDLDVRFEGGTHDRFTYAVDGQSGRAHGSVDIADHQYEAMYTHHTVWARNITSETPSAWSSKPRKSYTDIHLFRPQQAENVTFEQVSADDETLVFRANLTGEETRAMYFGPWSENSTATLTLYVDRDREIVTRATMDVTNDASAGRYLMSDDVSTGQFEATVSDVGETDVEKPESIPSPTTDELVNRLVVGLQRLDG
ncbi:hypothetical protein AUR64_13435 [Haloprofundus marisrubri]|uniref:Uncharacterized protein n=1 Tax=Haloprofundus marisrubri TaxID=1514971 RepID=A0A0W1R6J8_9EURY|nr:hypothetical protein [Haloprofundus marisrubri]KTG08816.1 hypothetical protein AUR64_13435 [Haloprofundus marisrubri]